MKYLLVLLLYIPTFAAAQKCNEIKDDFTGKTSTSSIVMLEGNIASAMFSTSLIFSKQDTTRMISLLFILGSVNDAIKKENLSLLIKFADDEVFKLPSNKYSTINTTTAGMRQGIQIAFSSNLSSQLLEKFANKAVSKIRLGFFEDNGYDIEIKDKKSKSIMDAMACIR